MIFIHPLEGMTIPHPDHNSAIDPEGALVPNSKFYRGFLKRGEATEGLPSSKSARKSKRKLKE